MKILYIL